jgi:hypothetical protein
MQFFDNNACLELAVKQKNQFAVYINSDYLGDDEGDCEMADGLIKKLQKKFKEDYRMELHSGGLLFFRYRKKPESFMLLISPVYASSIYAMLISPVYGVLDTNT